MNYLDLAFPSPSPAPADVEIAPAGPSAQLERDGFLLVRSSVLGGRLVLVVLDPTRIPEDLRHLARFDLTEVDKLLSLPREDARALLREIHRVKETIGGTLASVAEARP